VLLFKQHFGVSVRRFGSGSRGGWEEAGTDDDETRFALAGRVVGNKGNSFTSAKRGEG
jgi:hypothetical protein